MPAHADNPHPANLLGRETSPYLLQHAHNPVPWMPWGQAAFDEARRRNVPIFLSIGYSTCYWCHVMERESFEDEAIGRALGEHFVCLKVDREERPDVDDIYMTAVQLMTRRGGWPMSVWLTPPGARGGRDEHDPGLEPFYAGTYFPAEPRHGMPSLPQLIEGISEAWKNNRSQVLEQASSIAGAIREQIARRADPAPVGEPQITQAVSQLLRLYEPTHGGFGHAPKFPQPVFLDFLLDARSSITDPAAQSSVDRAIRHTLDAMALGGLFDHLGGGFHRYSTDEQWLVPHFEKMLYDNAQLASIYARAYSLWHDDFDARILRRTLDYVLREMTDAATEGEGAFFSAQDAEVDGREGLNYLWTRDEMTAALDESDAAFAAEIYGLNPGPNFRDPHHPDEPPRNVLFLKSRPEAIARDFNMKANEFLTRLDTINERLLAAQSRRKQPRLDDKVLASWNGLTIAALADAASALNEPNYLHAAERAARYILNHMTTGSDARLLRTARAGIVKEIPGFLEDYAFLIQGLLALHRAAIHLNQPRRDHLPAATRLADSAITRFADPARPGFFFDTEPDQTDLLARGRGTHDGAIPSAASVMAHNFLDLAAAMPDEPRWAELARDTLVSLSGPIAESPLAAVNSTRALLRLLRADPAATETLSSINQTNPGPEVVRMDEAPVEVFAAAERIVVPETGAAELPIELRIREGFHVTAREPGVEGLSPLDVRVAEGTGVGITVNYPKGISYSGDALPESERGRMFVHHGTVRLDARLSRTSEKWSGRPIILVTYQACDDNACYQPITVELDVAIDQG